MTPVAGDSLDRLRWIMARRIESYLDVAGRPLGEGRSPEIARAVTVMQPCPYAGSRLRHANPMNLSALRAMPAWSAVLAALSELSRRFTDRSGRPVRSCEDLALVTAAGIFLPDFLALRREHPIPSGAMPLQVSAVYKVCLGFQLAYLPERYSGHAAETRLPDDSGFYEYLEGNGLLVGETEVCSGSPAMITQAYSAFLHPERRRSEVTASDGKASEGVWPMLDWRAFQDFAEAVGAIWHDLIQFAMRLERHLIALESPDIPASARTVLNPLLLARTAELSRARRGLVCEIARAALQGGARPAPAENAAGRGKFAGLSGPTAARMTDLLVSAAPGATAGIADQIRKDLQHQFEVWAAHEEGRLESLGARLAAAISALGYERTSIAIERPILVELCGPTPLDLPAPANV
jgi:hypothetical protein